MKRYYLTAALSILAITLATSSTQTVTPPAPKKSFQDLTLLDRLVMQYRVNQALIKQNQIMMNPRLTNQTRNKIMMTIKQVRKQQQYIVRRAVLAGIFPAFRAAIEVKKALKPRFQKKPKPRPRPKN